MIFAVASGSIISFAGDTVKTLSTPDIDLLTVRFSSKPTYFPKFFMFSTVSTPPTTCKKAFALPVSVPKLQLLLSRSIAKPVVLRSITVSSEQVTFLKPTPPVPETMNFDKRLPALSSGISSMFMKSKLYFGERVEIPRSVSFLMCSGSALLMRRNAGGDVPRFVGRVSEDVSMSSFNMISLNLSFGTAASASSMLG